MTTAAAQIALRRRREQAKEPEPAVTMWFFPYLSYAAIGCMGAVLVAMAFTPGMRKDFWFSCVTLALTVIAFFVVWRLRQPRAAASTVA
jgi:GABA permease